MKIKDVINITEALDEAWEISPARRAANLLIKMGYTSQDFATFCKTKDAWGIDEVWKNNTLNELRDIERT